jgi:hypothetical protein
MQRRKKEEFIGRPSKKELEQHREVTSAISTPASTFGTSVRKQHVCAWRRRVKKASRVLLSAAFFIDQINSDKYVSSG